MLVGAATKWEDITDVKREPDEHRARLEASADLVNPLVVKRHPSWAAVNGDMAWLDVLPEARVVHATPCLCWIQRPATLSGEVPETD